MKKYLKYLCIIAVVICTIIILMVSNSGRSKMISGNREINESSEVVYIIDNITIKNNNLEVIGWAYLNNTESTQQKTYIEIRDNDQQIKRFTTDRINTPELAEYFSNEKYGQIRFSSKIPIGYLDKNKTYEATIVIEDNNQLYSNNSYQKMEFRYMYIKNLMYKISLYILAIIIVLAFTLYRNKTVECINKWSPNSIDIIFIAGITIVFFSLMPVLTFDSMWYHTYLDIFNGVKPITEWDPTRGLLFPLLIFLSTKLFGYTTQGITITMYIFYLISVIFIFKFIKILGINACTNMKRIGVWSILVFLIYLNPVFIGYYHLVLTEFVIATLIIVYAYIIYKLGLKQEIVDQERLRKIHVLRGGTTIIFACICFFIKQMYAAPIVLIYIASDILYSIKKKKILNIPIVLATICISLVSIISIDTAWGKIINIKEAKNLVGAPTSNEMMLGDVVKNGARYFEPVKESCIYNKDTYSIDINIMEDNQVKDSFVYIGSTNVIKDSINYLTTCLTKDPIKLLQGYFDNYMIISNVYRYAGDVAEKGLAYAPIDKKVSLVYAYENNINGMNNRYVKLGTPVYTGFFEEWYHIQNGNQYEQLFDTNILSKIIHKEGYIMFSNMIYSLVALLAFPIMIHSLIKSKRVAKFNDKYSVIFIMSFTIFTYISILSILGLNIDRYAFPMYSLCVFVIILYTQIIAKKISCLGKKIFCYIKTIK